MISDDKKKRIESLSPKEMLYEINLGRKSRFQREAFIYLQICYQNKLTKIENITPDQTTDKTKDKKPPDGISLRHFAFGVAVIIFSALVVWGINDYFTIGL